MRNNLAVGAGASYLRWAVRERWSGEGTHTTQKIADEMSKLLHKYLMLHLMERMEPAWDKACRTTAAGMYASKIFVTNKYPPTFFLHFFVSIFATPSNEPPCVIAPMQEVGTRDITRTNH